jgi:hypothetical protein
MNGYKGDSLQVRHFRGTETAKPDKERFRKGYGFWQSYISELSVASIRVGMNLWPHPCL